MAVVSVDLTQQHTLVMRQSHDPIPALLSGCNASIALSKITWDGSYGMGNFLALCRRLVCR